MNGWQIWNPWHGCHKISPGCQNCYVYRTDSRYGKDSSIVTKTANFDLPIRRGRNKEYKLKPGYDVFTCGTSDFFLEEADDWRKDAWSMIKARPDLDFLIITKRIHRFTINLPADWGEGYENVSIGCTMENQEMADYRMSFFIEAKIKHRIIITEPLLGPLDLSCYLVQGGFDMLTAGGESGENARILDYQWILDLREQCVEYNLPFYFKQTGKYLKKDGRVYNIERKYQHAQAKRAGVNYLIGKLDI